MRVGSRMKGPCPSNRAHGRAERRSCAQDSLAEMSMDVVVSWWWTELGPGQLVPLALLSGAALRAGVGRGVGVIAGRLRARGKEG